jgi:hypothetical protein
MTYREMPSEFHAMSDRSPAGNAHGPVGGFVLTLPAAMTDLSR